MNVVRINKEFIIRVPLIEKEYNLSNIHELKEVDEHHFNNGVYIEYFEIDKNDDGPVIVKVKDRPEKTKFKTEPRIENPPPAVPPYKKDFYGRIKGEDIRMPLKKGKSRGLPDPPKIQIFESVKDAREYNYRIKSEHGSFQLEKKIKTRNSLLSMIKKLNTHSTKWVLAVEKDFHSIESCEEYYNRNIKTPEYKYL